MAKTVKSFEVSGAFWCDENVIIEIWNIIASIPDAIPEAEIDTSDGSKITFTDLAELTRFPNSRDRRIEQVTLASGYRAETITSVTFDGKYQPEIKTRISGEDKNVLFLHNEIWDRLKSLHLWYRRVGVVSRYVGPPLIGIAVPYFWKSASLEDTILYSLLFVIFFLLLAYLPARLNPVKWLFPPASFLIGSGAARWETSKTARRFLFGSVVVALLVSLGAAYIFELLHSKP